MIDALHPKTPKKCSKSSAFTKPMCYHRSKVCPNHHLKHRGVIHAHDNQTIHLIEPLKRLSMCLRRRRFMPRTTVRNARHRRHSRTSQRLLQHRRRQQRHRRHGNRLRAKCHVLRKRRRTRTSPTFTSRRRTFRRLSQSRRR